MAKKIYISPSNQNNNKYAYGNTTEDIVCGKIGKALETALKRCGFSTKYGQYDTIQNRVIASNNWGADMHIPVHTNAHNGEVGGTRVFYYENNGYGNKAAKYVYDELDHLSPGTSDNIYPAPDLYEIWATNATAVYVEAEFHDGQYAKWIIEHTAEIGEAICKGVCKYYGVNYISPSKTTTTVAKAETEEIYQIKWGDTLNKIAAKYNTTAKAIADYNGIKNINVIVTGQKIKIPNATSNKTPAKTIDELARECIKGLWGNGTLRRKNLESAGYDYDKVQARVNEILL